jgi:dihydrofolate reductase
MKAIAAMAKDRVIGFRGEIPWKKKVDMQFFRAMTWNQTVIVGRITHLKMGLLKNRFHYILSDSMNGSFAEKKNVRVAEFLTFEQLIKKHEIEEPWVIGGAKVYHQLLPFCSDLYLSIILDEYEGDSYMPHFEHLFNEQRLIKEFKDIWFVHYWKKGNEMEEAHREGFDAKLMGVAPLNNPYTSKPLISDLDWNIWRGWRDGHNEAPDIKGFNYDAV